MAVQKEGKLFFFNYQGDTRKVTCDAAKLSKPQDLVPLFMEKFKEQNMAVVDYEFWTTDKQYGVRHKIENESDIYEGAVIEVTQPVPNDAKRKREDDDSAGANKKVRTGPRFVLRLRGLPWECSNAQIKEFFSGVSLTECHVIFLPNGRATGEAIVEVDNQEDFDKAMAKNNDHIGHRYIEVFKSSGEDMDRALGRSSHDMMGGSMGGGGMGGPSDAPAMGPKSHKNMVVRMRGLPYSALEADIEEFFGQAGVKPAKVHIVREDAIGRPSGNAYVEFETEADHASAMACNRKNIGSRYIELFDARMEELVRVMGYGGYGQPPSWQMQQQGGMGGMQRYQGMGGMVANPYNPVTSPPQFQPDQGNNQCIRMRGLPYDCSEHEVTAFFQEAGVTPIRIHRKADGAEAFVEFHDSNDANKAMTRHKAYIKHRYIELFRVSYAEVAQTVGLAMHQPDVYGYSNPAGQRGRSGANSFFPPSGAYY